MARTVIKPPPYDMKQRINVTVQFG